MEDKVMIDNSAVLRRTSMGGLTKQLYQDAILNLDPDAELIVTDPKTELEGLFKKQIRKQHSYRKWKHIRPRAFRYLDEGHFFIPNVESCKATKKLFRRGAI